MLKPKKSLGQNFLIDKNTIKKLADLVDNYDNIIEIGPGTGNLTKEIISKKPSNLILIEKDNELYKLLKGELNYKNIKIMNKDVLQVDLEKLTSNKTVIFGNLPYNISTQILVKLLKFKKWPPKYTQLILMFQREVAERIMAKFNTKKYSRLTVISNWRLKIVRSFNVSNNCFYPKPKVDSTVLVLKPIENNKYKIKDISNLEKITQIFFSNKRKMINKNFKKLFSQYEEISQKLEIDLNLRPGALSENQYYKMCEFFESMNKKNL
jgi:16S rRNA (adenine1518-N6/adenine1519-N6)-dimethyltransferase